MAQVLDVDSLFDGTVPAYRRPARAVTPQDLFDHRDIERAHPAAGAGRDRGPAQSG